MARLLGIDWDMGPQGQGAVLRVVEALVQRGTVGVRRAAAWTELVSPNPVQAEEAGRRLRERLQEAGMAPAPVVYAIGRDRVVFREVRYPDVPAEEVPAVVRYQATKELTFPPEEAVINYAPCSIPGPLGEKRALTVVLRNELLSAIQKTCQAAGLRLQNVSVRSFGIVANWQAQMSAASTNDAEVSAVFVVTNGGGELCVAYRDELLFSRVVKPGADSAGNGAAAFLPELRRSLAAYSSQFPQHPVQVLFVAGEPLTTGPAILADSLRLKVVPFDPLAGIALPEWTEKAPFAAIMGLIQAQSAGGLPVDFLAPKEPRPPVNWKKRYLLAAAVVLLALLGGIGAAYGLAVSARNQQIEELQARIATFQKQIKSYGDVDKRLEAIHAWAASEIVVLDELYDLIARFPDQPGIRITKVAWSPITQPVHAQPARPTTSPRRAANAAARPIAQITLEASGDSAEALDRLRRALEAERHWTLDLWEPDASGRFQVRATLKVFRQEPHEYRAVLGQPRNVMPVPPGASTPGLAGTPSSAPAVAPSPSSPPPPQLRERGLGVRGSASPSPARREGPEVREGRP